MSFKKIERHGQKTLWAETPSAFREALKQREIPIEVTYELADELGLMVEDVGTEEEIEAARTDPYD